MSASTKSKVVRYMKSLGTYKKEFDPLIEIYSGLLDDYKVFIENYISDGRPTENEDGRQPPIIKQLETLRKDILAYSDRLKLNPKALQEDVIAETKGSKLDSFLQALGGESK